MNVFAKLLLDKQYNIALVKQMKKAQLKSDDLKRQRSKPHEEAQSENQSYDVDNELTKVKIGKIPYGWYDEFKHFGYDNKLQPVIKQKQQDKIQQFIKKSENKDWWRTIRDDLNARDIRLTDEQLNLIDRIRSGKMASKTIATSTFQVKYDYSDPFPIHAHPPSKKNFMPSKWEQMKVNKILDGLLTGRIKWNQEDEVQKEQEDLYDAWASGTIAERGVINIAPMKQKLPGHNQSYNPPKEYLLNKEELKEWQELDEEDRPFNFIPASYQKIRHIPFYDKLIQEKFQRCLDLYLCPRVKKKKLNIDPDTLIPKLPDPSSMKPFPTAINITYIGHEHSVISLSASPEGQYLATGDDSGLLIIWEALSSRILWQRKFQQPIHSIDWSINNFIVFSHADTVELMAWKYSKALKAKAEELINESREANQQNSKTDHWTFYSPDSEEYLSGLRLHLTFDADVTHVEFQKTKADYFVTVCPDHAKKNQVISIHRLSKAATQTNFIKGNGIFKKVSFYPKKPQIVILTQARVVIFDLEQLISAKKLSAGTNTYSCMAVHPSGGYVMVGSQNCKLMCYDLDLSSKPYKSMQFHEKEVTEISYHKEYPMMASASNDGTIHIFHFKDDPSTLSNAVIVPLKVLRGHTVKNMEGVKNIKFHPKQPWLFSAGKDGKVFLWT